MKDILFKNTIIISLIINVILVFKINRHNLNVSTSKNTYIEQNLNEHNNNIYKELFQLYIDDRKKFYLKGRQYIMRINNLIYNESNLLTIQDKLNYLLIHESPENKTEIVDKIKLRKYSKKILGKDICAPIIKVFNNVEEINLDELPDKFVLKCNHGSNMNIFCEDKSKFDLPKAKRKLKEWMNFNYGLFSFEYQYLNVKRKVFAEKFLDKEIINYKFSCFNGKPKFIRVKGNINGTNLYNIYNLNWTQANIELYKENYILTNRFERPVNLKKMIDYSKLLSSEFCFCRVDFYEIKGILYLGEITFTPFNAHMKYKTKEMEIQYFR